jgi:flagellar biosynthesis GTPase FlhF
MLDITTKDELNKEEELARHAEAIRVLGKRIMHDIIEIGQRLEKAQILAGHGNWDDWLRKQLHWKSSTAAKYMKVSEMLCSCFVSNLRHAGDSKQTPNMDLSIDGLYLLTFKSTPDEVRDDVLDRASKGEQFTQAQIKKMIADAKAAEEKVREAAQVAHDKAMKKQLTEKEEELKAKLAEKEKKIRAEYEDALTKEQVKETIEKKTKKLREDLKKAQEKIHDLENSDEDHEKGLRVVRYNGLMQRALGATHLARQEIDLTEIDLDETLRTAVREAAAAWNELSTSLKGKQK